MVRLFLGLSRRIAVVKNVDARELDEMFEVSSVNSISSVDLGKNRGAAPGQGGCHLKLSDLCALCCCCC
jgi:hypothetical protein